MSIDSRLLENISRMKEQDVCALFANLIENAVEAATREISVVIREKHNMIYVEVRNDCKKMPVIKKDGSIQSTKENPREHGWGMISINEVVRKYHGTIFAIQSVRESETINCNVLKKYQKAQPTLVGKGSCKNE